MKTLHVILHSGLCFGAMGHRTEPDSLLSLVPAVAHNYKSCYPLWLTMLDLVTSTAPSHVSEMLSDVISNAVVHCRDSVLALCPIAANQNSALLPTARNQILRCN
jgi:hypothetical protein